MNACWISCLLLLSSGGQVEVEAIPGQPFGVGRMSIRLAGANAQQVWETNGFALQERRGRALYPVFTQGRVRRWIGANLLGDDSAPDHLTAYFLFVGEEPLELTFFAPHPHQAAVRPRPQRRLATNRLKNQWWREYSAAAREQVAAGDHPPLDRKSVV